MSLGAYFLNPGGDQLRPSDLFPSDAPPPPIISSGGALMINLGALVFLQGSFVHSGFGIATRRRGLKPTYLRRTEDMDDVLPAYVCLSENLSENLGTR